MEARFRLTPVPKGSVRVLLDPTPTDRLRQLGTVALLTSPLWGYAIYRNRHAVLSALRGLLPSIHRQAVFGTLVDDARERWLRLKAQADAATAAARDPQNPDPTAASKNANTLQFLASQAEADFKIAEAAAAEARATPLKTIDLRKVRQVKDEAAGRSTVSLGTVAILASPLVIAALLVWRTR